MTALKCKICGEELFIAEDNKSNICRCDFCGAEQTVPFADDDKKVRLFNRANRLRMNGEFDKAAAVYTSITTEYPEEAEAYWDLCLCKYGIEYAEDPAAGRGTPVCRRILPGSIMLDTDFEQACEYATPDSKRLYREEAIAIDRQQRNMLSIAADEKPFDVFICCRETDEDGERTGGSVTAQEIYDILTEKGMRVFFGRITLADRAGEQNEPYIYAALHSARVMLVVGTGFECFDAARVKNEWARYLGIMRTDRSKTLIPCFGGTDVYDLPREFADLQTLNMTEPGWKRELIRRVAEFMSADAEPERADAEQQAAAGAGAVNRGRTENLMKRARLFMEDGETEKAAEYLDKILDEDAEYAPAYVAKVCLASGIRREEELSGSESVFTDNADWKRAVRFATPEQRKTYRGYAAAVQSRIVKKEMPGYTAPEQYRKAKELLAPYEEYEEAAEILSRLDQAIENQLQHEQKMAGARIVIEELKRNYEGKRSEYNRNRYELKNKEAKIGEIQQRIDRSTQKIMELTRKKSEMKGILFKRKEETENLVYMERKKRDVLRGQLADEKKRYNQLMEKTEQNGDDERNLQYDIARVFCEHELYEEAAAAYYRIISFMDVKDIVTGDEKISEAVKNLISKAVQRAPETQKRVLEKAEQKNIPTENGGYCREEVDEYITEIIVKSFSALNEEEKEKQIAEIQRKEFSTQETGYSKKEVKDLLDGLAFCCYAAGK